MSCEVLVLKLDIKSVHYSCVEQLQTNKWLEHLVLKGQTHSVKHQTHEEPVIYNSL